MNDAERRERFEQEMAALAEPISSGNSLDSSLTFGRACDTPVLCDRSIADTPPPWQNRDSEFSTMIPYESPLGLDAILKEFNADAEERHQQFLRDMAALDAPCSSTLSYSPEATTIASSCPQVMPSSDSSEPLEADLDEILDLYMDSPSQVTSLSEVASLEVASSDSDSGNVEDRIRTHMRRFSHRAEPIYITAPTSEPEKSNWIWKAAAAVATVTAVGLCAFATWSW